MLGDSGDDSKDNNVIYVEFKLLENWIRILAACRQIKINKFMVLINERIGDKRVIFKKLSLRN